MIENKYIFVYGAGISGCGVAEVLAKNEKQVIFGHTPAYGEAYMTENGNLGIDTGCVFGYNLCAVIKEDGEWTPYYQKKNELD